MKYEQPQVHESMIMSQEEVKNSPLMRPQDLPSDNDNSIGNNTPAFK